LGSAQKKSHREDFTGGISRKKNRRVDGRKKGVALIPTRKKSSTRKGIENVGVYEMAANRRARAKGAKKPEKNLLGE